MMSGLGSLITVRQSVLNLARAARTFCRQIYILPMKERWQLPTRHLYRCSLSIESLIYASHVLPCSTLCDSLLLFFGSARRVQHWLRSYKRRGVEQQDRSPMVHSDGPLIQ